MQGPRRDRTLGGIDLPLQADAAWASTMGTDTNADHDAGTAPFRRGIHPGMYRTRRWTMRQYAGFSSADATNDRFKLLLSRGQTGLSVAFDLPTQIGLDPDHPMARGEVGRVGVSISTLEDMRRLFDGIDLGEVSTSMTINASAMVLLAMYVAVAEEQGVDARSLRGTIQNDILKEYIARGTHIFPPGPSMRLITDIFEWCAEHAPNWNTISVSGYHIREAGSTAAQEIAYTLSNGIEYLTAAMERGLSVDDVAPRMSFFFNCHNDFFEEIAKFRAARVLWHDLVSERFAPNNPKSLMLRFHTQVAGVSLTAQQPLNNVARVTIQALAAICGGTQSLHTNSYDEALGLPTESSATLALRTQQIISEESGAADVVDPMGGSYLVEGLTDALIDLARTEIDRIDEFGGAMKAIESGHQQRAIHEAAWHHQRDVEEGRRRIIGVNHGTTEERLEIDLQASDDGLEGTQIDRLQSWRAQREDVTDVLAMIQSVAQTNENLFPHVLAAVRNGATIGEICGVLRGTFGEYTPPSGV